MPVATPLKDYYAILGVATTSTDEEIKTAYKELALQWHPDRHAVRKEDAGRKFIEIHEAYKFLTDKGRREWYDKFRETGDKSKERGWPAPEMKKAPSAGGGLGVPTAEPKRSKSESGLRSAAQAAEAGLKVPSAGPQRAGSHSRTPNPAAQSTPPSQEEKTRTRAKSTGDQKDPKFAADLRDFIHRMTKGEKQGNTDSKDPSFQSHKATVYDESESDDLSMQDAGMQLYTTTVVTTGIPSEWIFPLPLTLEELYEGTAHRYRITRHLLSGKKKNIMVDVEVAPGWKKGTKIRFSGAGNERPGGAPQDVVFVVEELPHEQFMREGSTLIARVQISLCDALAGEGRSIVLKGLDGRDIEVPLPTCVIKPGSEYCVEGAGMPIRKQGKIVGKGDMIIRWEISFPNKLSRKQAQQLRAILEG